MNERDLFPKPRELNNTQAVLKLVGEAAQKTATVAFKFARDYPVYSLGLGITLGGLGANATIDEPSLVSVVAVAGICTMIAGAIVEVIPRSEGTDRISIPRAIGRGISAGREWWTSYKRGNSSFR